MTGAILRDRGQRVITQERFVLLCNLPGQVTQRLYLRPQINLRLHIGTGATRSSYGRYL